MATSTIKLLLSSRDENPLSNIQGFASVTGEIKYLFFITPVSAMQYRVDYNCGTLPVKYRPHSDVNRVVISGNGRDYMTTIRKNGEVIITCLTDNLPEGGKPFISIGTTYS